MQLRHLRCLPGPNVWAACPVFEAVLDLEGEASPEDLAEAFTRAALHLQTQAGNPVAFAATRAMDQPGLVLAAFEFAEEPVGQEAAAVAWRHLQDGQPLDREEDLKRLRDLAYQQRLPASTAVIYHAARARGIPAVRLSPEYGRFLRLGQGAKQYRCQASETGEIGAVARTLSTDKHLAKEILRAAGVPVPRGRLVASAEEAWAAANELGLPVAMKPQDSDLAIGVSLDLRTREQVEAGFRTANEHSTCVIVERFAPGMEHRVLVVADKIAAVTRIEPPHVVGDGVATVAELVGRVNRDPRRGDEGSGAPLSKLKIDDVALGVLAGQGCTLDTVPQRGQRVLVRRNPPYFKNGGNLSDLTDLIHPSTAAHAIAAAQALQLRVAGLDVVAIDIAQPLEEQGGVIVEINAGAGLWLHMAPWADSPRPIGDAIVASMFPPGHDGRIPVAAVIGETASKHLNALLTHSGLRVGAVDAESITVATRRWPVSGTPQARANALMQFPALDVALLATSARELVRAGLGNDRCDVALALNTAAAPDGEAGPAIGEFLHALRHALSPGGAVVLPAGAEAAPFSLEQIVFVATQGLASVRDHLASGGRAIALEGNELYLANSRTAPVNIGKRPPGTTADDLPGLLGALGAGHVLGHKAEVLASYLRSLP